MIWLKRFLLFCLFAFSLSAAEPLEEQLKTQKTLLQNLSELMKQGQLNTQNLKNSITAKEKEIKSLEISMKKFKENSTITLNQKEEELKQKENTLIALRESSALDKKSLISLSKDLTVLEKLFYRTKMWNNILIGVCSVLGLAVLVGGFFLFRKK